MKVFGQDPSLYINNLNLQFACAVDSAKRAVIDSLHFRFVNYEFYYLSSPEAGLTFDEDPIRYCGVLTDPVSRQRFFPGDSSPRLAIDKHLYYFWSDSTKQVFEMMPDMYAMPSYAMLPPTDTTKQAPAPH